MRLNVDIMDYTIPPTNSSTQSSNPDGRQSIGWCWLMLVSLLMLGEITPCCEWEKKCGYFSSKWPQKCGGLVLIMTNWWVYLGHWGPSDHSLDPFQRHQKDMYPNCRGSTMKHEDWFFWISKSPCCFIHLPKSWLLTPSTRSVWHTIATFYPRMAVEKKRLPRFLFHQPVGFCKKLMAYEKSKHNLQEFSIILPSGKLT